MQRSSKRIYSAGSLEAWFELLSRDWEEQFSASALRRAREIYRLGEILEIELGDGDAIIHAKFDKQPHYAVVEWGESGFSLRTSMEDIHAGKALGAAGLYEIEELVADEIPPVYTESTAPVPDRVVHSLAGSEQEEADQGRELRLALSVSSRSLRLEAEWIEADGSASAAFPASAAAEGTLNSAERETVIRLTTHAHRAGFFFEVRDGFYYLRGVGPILSFLRHELPRWKDQFPIGQSNAVGLLCEGTKRLELFVDADEAEEGVRLNWNFTIDGKALALDDARAVMRSGSEALILPEIGIVRLSQSQAHWVAEWRQNMGSDMTRVVPRYMAYSLFGIGEVEFNFAPTLEAWKRKLEDNSIRANGMIANLRAYQAAGVSWLHRVFDSECHALLADEMGLGKTLQALALIASRPLPAVPSIVVCPASVVPVWINEIRRFFPEINPRVLRRGETFLSDRAATLWLASYSQLRRHKPLLSEVEFGYAILDEAQFIKNPDAKVTHACLALRARHRLVLTGTPMENHPLDLWTLFQFLMPGLLGGRRPFEAMAKEETDAFIARLRRQITPFVLRRTKDEVIRDLPPKVESELLCPLTEVQQREYAGLTEQAIDSLGNDLDRAARKKAIHFFTLLTRLRQVCCDPDLLPWVNCDLDASGKLNILSSKLEGIFAGGHKVVIFSQFVALLRRIKQLLNRDYPGLLLVQLTGKTGDRDKPVRQFQDTPGPGAILVSLKAGGTGITLHAADYVFVLDPWWNPAVEEQAVDRVHRIGQDRTVFVYRIVTQGTVEERIKVLKEAKEQMFSRTIGGLRDVSVLLRHFGSLRDLIAYDLQYSSGFKGGDSPAEE